MTYLQAISQISLQEPLCEKWFETPVVPAAAYNESLDPDYKEFFAPMVARRMGKLLKRAVSTALDLQKRTDLENLDGIIIGTGLGCISNTEKFMNDMLDNDEENMSPTYFMQSTHNTIASQIALFLKCHGYNNTYSQRGISFESALFDAFLQMKLGELHKVIVGGHDEMTSAYFEMLGKVGWWKTGDISENVLRQANSEGSLSGSCSINMLLSDSRDDQTLCEIKEVQLFTQRTTAELKDELSILLKQNNLTLNDLDVIVCGFSGSRDNDAVYHHFLQETGFQKAVAWYKHLFGEGFCSAAFGLYAAANILKKNMLPPHLLYQNPSAQDIRHILVYNHFKNKEHSFILLSKC